MDSAQCHVSSAVYRHGTLIFCIYFNQKLKIHIRDAFITRYSESTVMDPNILDQLEKYIRSSTKDHFIQTSRLEDWGLLTTYYGEKAEDLVQELMRSPAMNLANTALKATESIFRAIISPDILHGISISANTKEIALERTPETLIDFFHDESAKTKLRELETMEYNRLVDQLIGLFKSIKTGKKRIEIDSLIMIMEPSVQPHFLEFKMFTSSLGDPDAGLSRYLEPAKLKKYLKDRNSLYCLIALSFIHEPVQGGNKQLKGLPLTEPFPIDLENDNEDLKSSWALHLCILNDRALQVTPRKNILRNVIQSGIGQHQAGIKANFFPERDLYLRITFNYVKVVEMTSLIQQLVQEKDRIVEEKDRIEKESVRKLQEKDEEIQRLKALLKDSQ